MHQLLRAHEYWRTKRLAVDLVIINEHPSSYIQRPAGGDRERRAQQPVPAAPGRGAGHGACAARRPHDRRGAVTLRCCRQGRAACAARADRGPARAAAIAGHDALPGSRPVGCNSGAGDTAAGARILQRPRRIRQGRDRVRDDHRRARDDARALDQCCRQSGVRLPGLGGGQRPCLGREQPREPADAVVERSRCRSFRRGALRARRDHRQHLDCNRTADPRRWAVRRPPRFRLQSFRARGPRYRARPVAIRAAGQFGPDLAADAHQQLRPASPPFGDGLCRMGARHLPGGVWGAYRHRDRSRDRRAAGAQSLEHRLPGTRRLR